MRAGMVSRCLASLLVLSAVNSAYAESCAPLAEHIEIYDDELSSVVSSSSEICMIQDGFRWTEGPLWMPELEVLLFSDIPAGKVHQYEPCKGVSVYLDDSGFSNGLLRSPSGELVLMQSRTRQVGAMSSTINSPTTVYKTLASHFEGRRLNSPNDGVFHSSGALFFTDPPFGLPKQFDDENKELDFQGVFKLSESGELSLVDDGISHPNGIGISPDEQWLYVAVSNEADMRWYRYPLNGDGDVGERELFYKVDVANAYSEIVEEKGVPDGLKFHENGMLFATGPQGVWIFNHNKEVLGRIFVDSFVANLAFDENYSTLYLTAHQSLMKVKLVNQFDKE